MLWAQHGFLLGWSIKANDIHWAWKKMPLMANYVSDKVSGRYWSNHVFFLSAYSFPEDSEAKPLTGNHIFLVEGLSSVAMILMTTNILWPQSVCACVMEEMTHLTCWRGQKGFGGFSKFVHMRLLSVYSLVHYRIHNPKMSLLLACMRSFVLPTQLNQFVH